jgi:hypothetical protein
MDQHKRTRASQVGAEGCQHLDQCLLWRMPSSVAVFGVGDVVAPGGRTAGDGDVGHEMVVGGAVPVLLTVGGDVDVARPDLDGLFAACSDEAAAFGDVERLAAVVGMPGGPGAGGEMDRADVELRIPLRLDDRVDSHVACEPVGWPFDGRRFRLTSHDSLLGRSRSAFDGPVVGWRGAQLASRSSASCARLPGSAL